MYTQTRVYTHMHVRTCVLKRTRVQAAAAVAALDGQHIDGAKVKVNNHTQLTQHAHTHSHTHTHTHTHTPTLSLSLSPQNSHPTSLITRHTSLVTRHSSHVTRHTSHVTRHRLRLRVPKSQVAVIVGPHHAVMVMEAGDA